MRSVEDKGCLSSNEMTNFEFHKGSNGLLVNRTPSHHRTALGKPTPSKWDDAQKWLVNLSRGEKNPAKASPRSSNADDRRLIAPPPPKDWEEEEDDGGGECDMETKDIVDCEETVWRISKHGGGAAAPAVRSVCVRDTGTEMTPIASQEPSRTATPIRATTPAARSPISSGTSTPVRCPDGIMVSSSDNRQIVTVSNNVGAGQLAREGENCSGENAAENKNEDRSGTLESRAVAWDEAERAKYMARYKREEVKIQAWENHQKRKAEMEMRKAEVKAERMKCRAQEKYTNKVAAARRIAEEKRANAEAKLNEKGVKTSERADYIRRTGHLPSSLSFKLPSFCW